MGRKHTHTHGKGEELFILLVLEGEDDSSSSSNNSDFSLNNASRGIILDTINIMILNGQKRIISGNKKLQTEVPP